MVTPRISKNTRSQSVAVGSKFRPSAMRNLEGKTVAFAQGTDNAVIRLKHMGFYFGGQLAFLC